MADYYPLIAKAVASLPQSTPETRGAIYERARTALITQLNKLDTPVPPEAIEREEKSLASAVALLESEIASKREEGPAKEYESLTSGAIEVSSAIAPSQLSNSAPSPEDKSASPAQQEAASEKKNEAAEKESALEPQARPSQELFGSTSGKLLADKAPQTEPAREPILNMPLQMAPALKLPKIAAEGELAEAAAPKNQALPLPTPAVLNRAEGGPQPDNRELAEPALPLPKVPPRAEVQRPFAPQPKAEPGPPKRLWILGFVLAIIVALVAVAAWRLRDRPESFLRPAKIVAPVSSELAPRGKISDRLEGGQTPEVQSPQGASGSETGQAPAESQPQMAATPIESPRLAKGAPVPNDLGLTQHRAALLVETPDDPAKVKTMTGSVEWRLDNVASGPDQPLSTAVDADIDIPEAKFKASMVFQKNFDPSLPASHTIKITFVQEPGSTVSAVQQISLPQMRRQDAATGETLNGVPVPIMENSFLIGLSRGTAEPNNLNLIQSHEWMDFPMLLANGRIAKLTFEKGPQGSSAIDDAIASWAAQP